LLLPKSFGQYRPLTYVSLGKELVNETCRTHEVFCWHFANKTLAKYAK